LTIGDSCAR